MKRRGFCVDRLIIGSACLAFLIAVIGAVVMGFLAASPADRVQFAEKVLAWATGVLTGMFAIAQGKKAMEQAISTGPTEKVEINAPAGEGEAGG